MQIFDQYHLQAQIFRSKYALFLFKIFRQLREFRFFGLNGPLPGVDFCREFFYLQLTVTHSKLELFLFLQMLQIESVQLCFMICFNFLNVALYEIVKLKSYLDLILKLLLQ